MQHGRAEEQTDQAEEPLRRVIDLLRNPAEIWPTFRAYLGFGRRRRLEKIVDKRGLQDFLETRISFVAQTSLYGYLRTRAGQRYPELFDDKGFIESVNIAKWQIWLACLSDLSVYAGGLMAQAMPDASSRIGAFMLDSVVDILDRTGIPTDAGPDFASTAGLVRQRLRQCDWSSVGDDDRVFTESPPALVKWAPIVEHLKALDEPIVLNSVRFRWQEVRRDLRRSLDVSAILPQQA